MSQAEIERKAQEFAAELAAAKRAREEQGGQLADQGRAIAAMQAKMLEVQQAQDATARATVEQRAGTNRELDLYVARSADDMRGLPPQDRANYLVTDKGAVRLRGHYRDVEGPDRQLYKVWAWGLLDDPDPRSDAQLAAQRAVTRRSIVRGHMAADRRFTPRCDAEVIAELRACGGHVERIFADSAGIGAEWIPDRTLPELERDVEVATNFTSMFERRDIGPGGTVHLPYRSGKLRVYKGAVPSTDNPADAILSSMTTAERTIDTVPAAVSTQVHRDATEDSIIAVVPEITRDMLLAFTYADDDTWINGDTAATHQDAIATWDGRSELGGTTGLGTTADHRRRWLGLRPRAFDLTSMTTDQNAAQTWDGLRTALLKLGAKNLIAAHLGRMTSIVVAPSWEYFFSKMLDWDEFASWDKVGQFASVLLGTIGNPGSTPGGMLPGQVGFVEGFIPVCIPYPLTADLAATGLYTGSGSTTGMLQFDRSRFQHCVRRGMTLESETSIRNDTVTYVARMRSVGRAKDAVASTIKDVHYSFNLTV